MSLRRLFLATALVALSMSHHSIACAQTVGAPALHRGTNLSSWLANARNRQSFGPDDFRRIKQQGFDFVRLPVNPEFFGFSLDGQSGQTATMNYAQIDAAIQQITQAGLAVVLDIHPGANFMKTLEQGGSANDRVVELWGALAERYKNVPSNVLAYELLNEPQYYNHADSYNALIAMIVRRIRVADANRLLIIESPAVTSINPVDSLNQVKVMPDPNVAYDVHFYQPYIVTHQGIGRGFGAKQVPFFLNVPYPSNLVDKGKIQLSPQGDHGKAMDEIDAYVREGWDKNRIKSYISPAAGWAQSHRVRLLILEYGVIKDGPARNDTDPGTRARWLGDVTSTLDNLSTGTTPYIGRAVWDESDNFGIDDMKGPTSKDPNDGSIRFTQPGGGTRTIQPAIARALGLPPG
jgi:hypothetical protein